MDVEVAGLQVKQAARPSEVVQQMAVDVEQIGIIAYSCDDVLVPDLGQQRTAGHFQWPILPLAFVADGFHSRPPFCTACSSGLSLSPSKHSSRPVG